MITNVDYLIQKYAEAREKVNNDKGDRNYRNYWQGAMDTYHCVLTNFDGWAASGTGWYVFYEGMTYDAALAAAQQEMETSLIDTVMTRRETLIKGGFIPVDLKAGNVKVGDSIANNNMCFGELVSITKRGNYMVQFDMDYMDEKPTRFDAETFERFFLVDKRKK